jgi:hypothetical protein
MVGGIFGSPVLRDWRNSIGMRISRIFLLVVLRYNGISEKIVGRLLERFLLTGL